MVGIRRELKKKKREKSVQNINEMPGFRIELIIER